jgi:pyruvate dehydrogenase E2 component (dihydrolipoamide acetyltransferase)
MSIEVRLPQESMAMLEGTVVKWLKSVGEPVAKGEPLAEVEADKTTFEIVAPAAGILASVAVAAGESVPVRTLLATIADSNEDPGADSSRHQSPEPSSTGSPDSTSRAQPTAGASQVVPAARRLAREHGIELTSVSGTGPGGRIIEADVRAAIDAIRTSSDLDSATSRVIPLRGVRGRVAERMRESLQSMAQLTLTTEADITQLVKDRDAVKARIPVTYTHLLLRAGAVALRQHPRLNAVIEADQIQECHDINIGIAVPLTEGVIVPVVRGVDQMTLAELIEVSNEAVAQVRERRATPDLVSGGTFTVSNLGTFGIDSFTPIINPPEVAILGVGRITDKPVPSDGGLAWRKVITLSLTIDHRAVDGVPGAQFLQTLANLLNQPQALLAGAD